MSSIVNPICPPSPLAYDVLISQVIPKLFTVKVVDGDLAWCTICACWVCTVEVPCTHKQTNISWGLVKAYIPQLTIGQLFTFAWSQTVGSMNRPFYRYGGHIEFIRFKEYDRMPRGHEHISFVFRALLGTFFRKVFLELDCNGKKRSLCRVWM